MNLTIERIYISTEDGEQEEAGLVTEETEVIVSMKNGEKFHASFFSFAGLQALRKRYLETGEFLHGAYFWSKTMILIDHCSRELIEKVVLDLVEEGELGEAFQKL